MSEFPLIVARDTSKRVYREGRWLTSVEAVPVSGTGPGQAQRAAQAVKEALHFGDPSVEGSKVFFASPVDHYEHMATLKRIESQFGVLLNKRFGVSFFGVREAKGLAMHAGFTRFGKRFDFYIEPDMEDRRPKAQRYKLSVRVDRGSPQHVGFYPSASLSRKAAEKWLKAQRPKRPGGKMMKEAELSRTAQEQLRAAVKERVREDLVRGPVPGPGVPVAA